MEKFEIEFTFEMSGKHVIEAESLEKAQSEARDLIGDGDYGSAYMPNITHLD